MKTAEDKKRGGGGGRAHLSPLPISVSSLLVSSAGVLSFLRLDLQSEAWSACLFTYCEPATLFGRLHDDTYETTQKHDDLRGPLYSKVISA